MQANSSAKVDAFVSQLKDAVPSVAETVPSEEEEARFEEAINAFVGGVLRRLSESAESE